MGRALIALGSNLGDRAAYVKNALAELEQISSILAVSRLYETAPVGPPQPSYLNAVALVDTSLEPRELLREMLAIEKRLGRERRERWGPRLVDLDLIAVDDQVFDEEGLQLPHPEAHRRAFVLVPLFDVAPDFVLPGHGRVRDLVEALPPTDRGGVVPVEDELRHPER